MSKPKVCLITPGHIATNPRLVKEIAALTEMGLQVHVVFTQYIEKLNSEDQKIIAQYPQLTFDALNWSSNDALSYCRKIYSGLLQKISRKLAAKFSGNLFKVLALNRHYFWQLRKAINTKSDLYIAHNLGALAVAVKAAKKNKMKCGFDAEDFHRFELSDDLFDNDVRLKISIEEKYMPMANYLSAASPLIANAYQELLNREITSILNVFQQVNIAIKTEIEDPIKLFWFSQTIGPNRGLETVIKAMGLLRTSRLELHLLGECSEFYKTQLIEMGRDQVIFYDTIGPNDLFQLASTFDIGMATETGMPYNREICLTNKIFTYLQSGLAIIASNTLAQKELINEYPNMGLIYNKNDENSLAACLKGFLNDHEKLLEAKKSSVELASNTFNWEIESVKFKRLVSKTIE
ncbi:MAG: glycosyltransferase [Bacteroidota bacterium]